MSTDNIVSWDRLSWPIRVGLVGGWISVVAFVLGFIKGLLLA